MREKKWLLRGHCVALGRRQPRGQVRNYWKFGGKSRDIIRKKRLGFVHYVSGRLPPLSFIQLRLTYPGRFVSIPRHFTRPLLGVVCPDWDELLWSDQSAFNLAVLLRNRWCKLKTEGFILSCHRYDLRIAYLIRRCYVNVLYTRLQWEDWSTFFEIVNDFQTCLFRIFVI